MSNLVANACAPLKMPPTAKAVLMCMAGYANDHGECFPSIPKISEYTCFGKTAVIAAIKWLEDSKAVTANRDNGRHTTYTVTPQSFQNPSASQTRPSGEPVRMPIHTRPAGEPDPSASRTGPVREADSNHQEPSRTIRATTNKRATASALPDWLEPAAWADWSDYRRKGKTPMTEKAVELSIRELDKLRGQGFDPKDVIENAILRGWRGLYAPPGGPPRTASVIPIRPSASADFRGKTYAGTAIDDLPPDLRDAARAAAADG
jgi:hypothetical protein